MKYPAGTRYSNSVIYDEATDEVIEGFQVFRQCNPDGTPTGRTSILVLDSDGAGCRLADDAAEAIAQADAILRAAGLSTYSEALAALRAEQEWHDRAADGALDPDWDYETLVGSKRRAAIERAVGIA